MTKGRWRGMPGIIGELGRRFQKLMKELADEGNAPETPDADESNMLDAQGEPAELDTPFTELRRALPVVRTMTPPQPGTAMSPDEVAAWDMLAQHGFSRIALEREGELEAYRSLGVRPDTEARWRKAYADDLLRDCEARPEGLDRAMWIAAEYGDMPLMARALEILDDAVTAEALRDGAVLGSCLCAMLALRDGIFDPAFTSEARVQALETANRAERRVREYLPDSKWLGIMDKVRALAGEVKP